MADPQHIHLLVESASDFWDRFGKLTQSFSDRKTNITVALLHNNGVYDQTRSNHSDDESFKEVVERIEKLSPILIQTLRISTKVQGNNKGGSFTFKLSEFGGYSVPVTWQTSDPPDPDSFSKLADTFKVASRSEAISVAIPEIANERFQSYQDAIGSLRDVAADLSRTQAKAITENTGFLTKATTDFNSLITVEQERLLELKKKYDDEIASERRELDEERAQLNLRESRKVRRELLDKMETLVEKQESFARSTETKSCVSPRLADT